MTPHLLHVACWEHGPFSVPLHRNPLTGEAMSQALPPCPKCKRISTEMCYEFLEDWGEPGLCVPLGPAIHQERPGSP